MRGYQFSHEPIFHNRPLLAISLSSRKEMKLYELLSLSFCLLFREGFSFDFQSHSLYRLTSVSSFWPDFIISILLRQWISRNTLDSDDSWLTCVSSCSASSLLLTCKPFLVDYPPATPHLTGFVGPDIPKSENDLGGRIGISGSKTTDWNSTKIRLWFKESSYRNRCCHSSAEGSFPMLRIWTSFLLMVRISVFVDIYSSVLSWAPLARYCTTRPIFISFPGLLWILL